MLDPIALRAHGRLLQVADEGPALDIVWAGPKHPLRYAYLAPPVTAAEDDSRKKKKKVKSAKTSTQTTKALPTVVIKEFDENRYARPITEDAAVKFLVSGLFGGTLLGLSMVPGAVLRKETRCPYY